MIDEQSQEAFESWEEDANAWGGVEADYAEYLQDRVNAFEDDGDTLREVMTYQEFARRKYDNFLLEVHKEDELDDEEEPFPGSEDDE